jgi:hypothetical protein
VAGVDLPGLQLHLETPAGIIPLAKLVLDPTQLLDMIAGASADTAGSLTAAAALASAQGGPPPGDPLAGVARRLGSRAISGVRWATGIKGGGFTIPSAQKNYVIETPAGTRFVFVRAVANGAPSNNVQAYIGIGVASGATQPDVSGLAYDANRAANNFVGFPMRPDQEYVFELDANAGQLNVATSIANTVIVGGFAGT